MHTKKNISAFCAAVLLAGSTAWASGKILSVNKESVGLSLKTWMIVGHKYQLQCSTNLVSGIWIDVDEEFTSDLTLTNLMVDAESKQCWFRVVEQKTDLSGPTTPPEAPPQGFPKMPPARPSF